MPKRLPFFEARPCDLQLIEVEEGGQKLLKVRGVFHRADEKNANNRIYPSKLLERETKRLSDRIGNSVFMQADHPSDGMSKVSQTAAILSSVSYDPATKEVVGEAKVLDTSLGKDLAAIVRAGGKVGISARGFGTTTPGECQGVKGDVVNEDYQLATFDFVVGQSTRDAVVSSFSEQAEALAGQVQGDDEMDISKMTMEDFKAARPDLFTKMEQSLVDAAKAANEKDINARVAAQVEEATEKIETKLRAELKLEAKKKKSAAADDEEDKADKGDDETTEQYQARLAPKLEKAGLKVVKADAAKADTAKVEQEVTVLRTQLNEALQSLKTVSNQTKAIQEQSQEIAVDKAIMESTKDEKRFRNALIERLRKDCKTVEEVTAKLPVVRAEIERLLTESGGARGKGVTGKDEEKGSGDETEKTFKTKSGLVLTESQVRQRELAHMPTELVD